MRPVFGKVAYCLPVDRHRINQGDDRAGRLHGEQKKVKAPPLSRFRG